MILCPRCQQENEETAHFCVSCGFNLANIGSQTERKDTYMGEVLEGKYLVLSHLGDGGMGKVYKAEHLTLKKPVAVKILHKHLLQNESQVKRFQREAWSASRLDHPNSISIIDFGQTVDHSHFIAMEYLEGRELTDVIVSDFPFPPERTVKIISQVLSVLHEAHENKIIHRDLKPENIMLIKRAEEGDFVKVLDFGIAKLQERDPDMPALTMQGIICGTPEYMSPEQALGKELDFRTDIYSAGCILYQMLTGDVPFNANNYQAVLGMHIRDEPKRPSEVRPDLNISPQLEEIALIAMNKERDMRFSNALAMKNALELAIRPKTAAQSNRRVVNAGGKTRVMGSGDELMLDVEKSFTSDGSVEGLPPLPDDAPIDLDEPIDLDGTSAVDLVAQETEAPTEDINAEKKDSIQDDLPSFSTAEFDGGKGIGIGKLVGVLVVLGVIAAMSLFWILGESEIVPVAEKVAAEVPTPAKTDSVPETIADSKKTSVPLEVGKPEKTVPVEKKEHSPELKKKEKISNKEQDKEPETKPRSKTAKVQKQIDRQKIALAQYERGKKAFNKGDYENAVRYFTKSKKYNPASPMVYKKLGMAYMRLGKKVQAKSNFERYLKLAPNAPDHARFKELYDSL